MLDHTANIWSRGDLLSITLPGEDKIKALREVMPKAKVVGVFENPFARGNDSVGRLALLRYEENDLQFTLVNRTGEKGLEFLDGYPHVANVPTFTCAYVDTVAAHAFYCIAVHRLAVFGTEIQFSDTALLENPGDVHRGSVVTASIAGLALFLHSPRAEKEDPITAKAMALVVDPALPDVSTLAGQIRKLKEFEFLGQRFWRIEVCVLHKVAEDGTQQELVVPVVAREDLIREGTVLEVGAYIWGRIWAHGSAALPHVATVM